MSKDRSLLLVDGHSLIHRAFHAIASLSSHGQPTNAVYGFVRMLIKLLKQEQPGCAAVVYDAPGPTFRHEALETYKAHRPEMTESLRSQIPIIREIVDALGVAQLELGGYEADDLLGTLATWAEGEGAHVLIVTGDQDVLQLVTERTHVLLTLKGISNTLRLDPAATREKLGFAPERLTDYKGLRGDPSDNLPGVRGVGEKTAKALLQTFGTVEEIIARGDAIEPASVGKAILASAEVARQTKHLATIVRDAPLRVAWKDVRLRRPDEIRLRALFSRYEFRSLLSEWTPDVARGQQELVLTP